MSTIITTTERSTTDRASTFIHNAVYDKPIKVISKWHPFTQIFKAFLFEAYLSYYAACRLRFAELSEFKFSNDCKKAAYDCQDQVQADI